MKKLLFSYFLFLTSLAFAQPANDDCSGAINLGTLPTPGACISGLQNGNPVTLNNQTTVGATSANPYIYQTGCQGGGNMQTFALDTWYMFTATGTTANVNITGFPNANVALYAGTCGNLLGRGCTILPNGGSGTLTVTQIQQGQTYYIQVSGNTTSATDNSFTIAVDNDIDCNDCLLNATLTANPAPVNGGYQPGQQVQFCYTVNGWSQQNTNWFHGVQITMSNGWTGTISNTIPAQTVQNIPGPGSDGDWLFYSNGIGNVNGQNWGAGFYFDTPDAGTIASDNYGDDCNGTNCSWTFCWTLTVKSNCTPGTPLVVTVNTSGDGESGSWPSTACADDAATIFNAVQVCCTAPTMASTPETCIGASDGSATATPGTGSAPWDYVWTNSAGQVVSSTNNVNGPNTVNNLPAGVYDVVITDNNNCVSSNTVSVGPGIDCQCLITNFSTNIGTCQTDNTFPVTGTVTYNNAPSTGTLVVEVTTATGTYTQTFNPPFVDGQVYNYNITNAVSDGSASTVEVYFTADPTCTQILNFTAPMACGCDAQIGTFTAVVSGSSTTNYVLCYGDQINITANGDYTPPGEALDPPNAGGYEPGISWLVYSCPPTIAVTPSDTPPNDWIGNDPCLIGITSDFNLNDVNNLSWINSYPGEFTNNTVYFVPITMYNLSENLYSYVNTDLPCYEMGTPFAVQYLPQITATQTYQCTGVTATINGGLPALNGSSFTAVQGSITPAGGSFVNTTASNGGTIAVIGLTPGAAYSFQVQDANGCPITVSGTMPAAPTLTYPQTSYCLSASNPSPTVTGGLGGTYSAAPAGLSINPSTGVITLATSTPGTYTITYTTPAVPGPACPATFVITVNPLPVIVANDVTVCVGGTTPVSASGAVTYTWSPATNLSGTTGSSVTFTAGTTTTYTVSGTDVNGCVNTDPVTVNVNGSAPINAGPDVAICAGASTTLTGTGGAIYSWAPGGQTTASVTVTPAATTTYTLTGTDANGCIGSDQVVVTVNPLPTVNAGTDQAVCAGASVTLTASGATAYSWDNGVTQGVEFAPAATTTYTVTGTTAAGCTGTDQVVVTVNPLPTVNAGTDQTVCAGTSVTLTASGASTYSWNNGVNQGVAFTPSATTTYTVTGTSAAGCTSTDQVVVTVNPLPTVNAGIDQSVCSGTSVTLTATGASTYTWNNGVIQGVAFTPAVGSVTYSVTGTTTAGCTGTDQVIVTVNPNPTPTIQGPTEYCTGSFATLSTTQAYTGYSWSTGATTATTNATQANNPITVTVTNAFGCTGTSPAYTVTENNVITANFTETICQGQSVLIHGVSQSTAGTYSQTFTSETGCDSIANVTLVVNPLPVVSAGPDVAVCVGQSVTLTGSGAATYSWSGGIQNGVVFTPAVTTTYNVTGTSAAGCTNTDQVTVTVNPLPNVSAGPDQEACIGVAVTLSGSGASTYTWNNGVTNGVAFVPTGTTTYTVTGTSAAGCTGTDQVLVTVNPLPNINAGPDQTVCVGTSVTLAATGGVAYTWNNGVTNGVPFTPAVGSVTYSVTGTDIKGCTNTDQVVVNVNPLPTVNAGPDQTVCLGSTVTLTGAGAATYSWSGGIQNGQAFTPVAGTTTYTVTGTSTVGCINTDQVTVTVNPLPAVNAGPDQSVCDGTQVTLSATGAQNYSWTGGVSNGVAFTPAVGTTTYTVTGTDANGCVNTDAVNVTVNPIPNVFAGNNVVVCEGQTVILTASGANTYSWTGGVSQGVGFVPSVGITTYTVTGTSTAGCTNTDQVDVTVNLNPVVSFTPDQTIGCAPMTVNFTNTTAGASDCVWSFSNGTVLTGCGTVPVTFTQGGCYDVTLTTTVNGCTSTFAADNIVCLEEPPIAEFAPSSNSVSTLNTEVFFDNQSIGASTYLWNFGDGSQNSTEENPIHAFPTDEETNYTIMLIAASPLGCLDTAYSTIQVYEELIFYVPNTFTPDNDDYNPVFQPVFTAGFDPYDYTLYIFNRWGELIFESHDATVGWDGSYGSNGQIELCQDGVYTWKIEFKVTRWDERRQAVGHVNLIR